MICRLSGRVAHVSDLSGVIETAGGIAYEVLLPRATIGDLAERLGSEVTLHTFQYIEGNPTGSHFIPRLLGFLNPIDREFFGEFTKVKGVGMRKALRAMAMPSREIATAIERGDERTLTSLPEIGKKLATQICADLRGKLERFVIADAPAAPAERPMSSIQRVAIDILVSWGDRRPDAERLVGAAVDEQPELATPEDIVRSAYRLKHAARL